MIELPQIVFFILFTAWVTGKPLFIFYAQNDHIYGQKTEEPTLIYKERIILKIDTIWSGNIVADNKRVDFPFIRRIKVLEKIPCHCQTPQWP